MPPKRALTFEELLSLGIDEDSATKIVEKQSEAAPRIAVYQSDRIAEDVAAAVNEEFPEVNLHKKNWDKKK